MSENYAPGSAVVIQRTTQGSSGALVNADSLPTAVLVRNGADTGETVVVVNLSTGIYSFAFTIPLAWSLGDTVEVLAKATVAGTAGGAVVWSVVLASSTIMGPLVVVQSDALLTPSPVPLSMHAKSAKTFIFTVLQADGSVQDMSGMDLTFIVETDIAVPVQLFDVDQPPITVTGVSNEIVNVPVSVGDSTIATDEYRWRLWNLNTSEVIAHGPFMVVQTSA